MRSIRLTNYRAMMFGVTFALAATSVAVAQSRVVLPAGTVIFVGRSALTKPFDAKVPSGLTPKRDEEGYLIVAKGDRIVGARSKCHPSAIYR